MKEKIASHPLIDEFTKLAACVGAKPVPDKLFHYCSWEVAQSIQSNNEIWMTHISDMRNDHTEFNHGLDIFKGCLTDLKSLGFDEQWVNLLQGFLGNQKEPDLAPFVTCLTTKESCPDHWKTYGADGGGAVMVIDVKKIQACDHLSVKAINVVYGDQEKKQIVDEIKNSFVSLVKTLMGSVDLNADVAYVRALALAYFQIAYIHSLRFKAKSWAHEEEWRSVVLSKSAIVPPVYFRSGWKAKIRYLKMPLAINPIQNVVKGSKLK